MKNFFENKFFIYSFLLLYTFFIRIHSLTFEIISWDEATYILAGREILMGFLPYESFYEMKPPLLYYIYSIPLYIHSSVESVRIFGILCIFISASFCGSVSPKQTQVMTECFLPENSRSMAMA